MTYILQKLLGRVIPNMENLIGRDNTPIRDSETSLLIGYINTSNSENLIGYNLEGKGYTS